MYKLVYSWMDNCGQLRKYLNDVQAILFITAQRPIWYLFKIKEEATNTFISVINKFLGSGHSWKAKKKCWIRKRWTPRGDQQQHQQRKRPFRREASSGSAHCSAGRRSWGGTEQCRDDDGERKETKCPGENVVLFGNLTQSVTLCSNVMG